MPASQPVKVCEEPLVIPTYEVGPESRYAGFFHEGHGRIYPYTRRDDLLGRRSDHTYRAVYIENQYLKVIMLPELGGHLYSMWDKTGGREVFYRNRVIKPGLIGLRGAWIPTGIEFNFPVGHTVSTLSPVDYALVEQEDGHVGVEVSDIEQVTHMKWSVMATLHPERMSLRIRVRLYNRTELAQRYYYWANAAVKATDGLEFICDAPVAWNWHRTVSFPVAEDGRNLAWYRNYQHGSDVFTLGGESDFMGAYDHDGDAGIINVARLFELPGRKFFTWGTSERGATWTNVLTDEDGPYIEIQRGRFPTQADYGFLEPGELVEWTEHWYPVREMGGVAVANVDAAANLQIRPQAPGRRHERGAAAEHSSLQPQASGLADKAVIAVNVTRPFEALTVRLEHAGAPVFEETTSIRPDTRYRREAPAPSGNIENYRLLLIENNRPLLAYAPRPRRPIEVKDYEHLMPEAFRFQLRKRRTPRGKRRSAENIYRQAIMAVKMNQWKTAQARFRDILEVEPEHVGALVGLGRIEIWALRYHKAAEYLKSASVLDREHPRAHFYLGVARRRLGDARGAAEAFFQVAKRGVDLAHAARWQLGEMAAEAGEYQEACDHLQWSVRLSGRANRPAGILAALYRRTSRHAGAAEVARELLQRDATDFVALNELRLSLAAAGNAAEAGRLQEDLARRMRRTVQCYIETALEYAAAGLLEEAIEILAAYRPSKVEDTAGEAMLYYYQAWLACRKSPEAPAATGYLRKAGAASSDYVLPNRHEAESALLFALARDAADANANHFLGNLYASRFRLKEALRHWRRALASPRTVQSGASPRRKEAGAGAPHSPVILRNIGLAYWEQMSNPRAALPYYRKAVAADPSDYRLLAEADRLYSAAGKPLLRHRLWQRPAAGLMEHNEFRTRYLYYLAEVGRYKEAAKLLESYTFYSAEGDFGIRRIFDEVHAHLALEHLAAGRCQQALDEIRILEQQPANLLVDTARTESDNRKYLIEGDILAAMGKRAEAAAAWRAGAKRQMDWISPAVYFEGLCRKRLRDRKGVRDTGRFFERGLRNRKFQWPWIGETNVLFMEGLLLLLKGRRAGAMRKMREVLRHAPFHRGANYLLDTGGQVF